MSEHDRPSTFGRARLSFANAAEIDEFADMLARFERGELSPDDWRTYRLVRGTYGQRQAEDAQMLRVKIPQGVLTADQLIALADVAETYSRGFAHITTRQNVQFHFVRLHDVEPAMRRLAAAGLTTREACGNSVRNITTCPLAGVSDTEPFDVTPYAEALTRYFLRHPLSGVLPRKFKIGFEGCADDHVKLAINDIGWQARVRHGRRGFRVVVGGGTSTMARSAAELSDFLPAGEMLAVAEAVLRVFADLGDYRHKARNRMKFLIRAMGWERWREAFHERLAAVRAADPPRLPFDPEAAPAETPPDGPGAPPPDEDDIRRRVSSAVTTGPGIHPERLDAAASREALDAWRATNVRPQRQAGFVTATVSVPLGDLTGAQWRVLADLAWAYADGTVRVTATQNLVVRWVPERTVADLHRSIVAAGLGLAGADTMADVTSCPGAESCRLAVTQSRGLGRLLESHVRSRPSIIPLVPTLDVKISGCPNGCGQHHVAAIGFQGSLRKVGGRPVPQYFVMAGGGVGRDEASFGRLVAKVPARRAGEALERLARLFAAEREGDETAAAFFTRTDLPRLKALLADLEPLDAADAAPEDFVDLGEAAAFRPETLEGECSA